jgi:hypothetical protein
MRNFFGKVKDAIGSMRYGSSVERGLYWFIRVGLIVLPILVLLVIAGLIYANINGIEIKF